LSIADQICAEDLIEHQYLAPKGSGADILKAQITAARSSIDGLQLSIEDYVEAGDKFGSVCEREVRRCGTASPWSSTYSTYAASKTVG
jgi:hypothetical protein